MGGGTNGDPDGDTRAGNDQRAEQLSGSDVGGLPDFEDYEPDESDDDGAGEAGAETSAEVADADAGPGLSESETDTDDGPLGEGTGGSTVDADAEAIAAEIDELDLEDAAAVRPELVAMLERGESPEAVADGLLEAARSDRLTAGEDRDSVYELRRVLETDRDGENGLLGAADGVPVEGHEREWAMTKADKYGIGEAVMAEFAEEHGRDARRTVKQAQGEHLGKMFGEDSAPMHQVAAELTGNTRVPEDALGEEDETWGTPRDPFAFDVSDEDLDAYRAYSERTTEFLREHAGETVTLYRGYSGADGGAPSPAGVTPIGDQIADATRAGDSVTVPHRSVESWTTQPGIAANYGAGGVVVRREMPVERVVGIGATSGSLPGSEVVVAHDAERAYDPDEVVVDPTGNTDSVVREMVAQTGRKLAYADRRE